MNCVQVIREADGVRRGRCSASPGAVWCVLARAFVGILANAHVCPPVPSCCLVRSVELTRPVFQMVSGGKLFSHPSRLDRGYVLEKLMQFHRQHETPPSQIVSDLRTAAEQIPSANHIEEAMPLKGFHSKSRRSRLLN